MESCERVQKRGGTHVSDGDHRRLREVGALENRLDGGVRLEIDS
jgi:hypothetical protein